MHKHIVVALFLIACGGSPQSTTLVSDDGGGEELNVTCYDMDGDGIPDCVDCAPADPEIFQGATEVCNELDDDCDAATDEGVSASLWADCDGDGFADPAAVSFLGCEAPPVADTGCATSTQAWTSVNPETSPDCADDSPLVFSTQTAYQASARTDPNAFPENDFDFDCDFVETLEHPSLGGCVGSCTATAGWLTTVPDCGVSGSYITGCDMSCSPVFVTQTQRCL